MANNITNMKFDTGVPRDPTSDITTLPTITDIGVTVEGFATAINDGTRSLRRRRDTYPVARTGGQLGIGVPYNPQNAVTSY